MKNTTTPRGFKRQEFIDQYGHECSVQKSSLGTEECIWLGIDNSKIKIGMPWMDITDVIQSLADAVNQASSSLNPDKGSVVVDSRMHLTRKQVAELIPVLQHFVDTGELPE